MHFLCQLYYTCKQHVTREITNNINDYAYIHANISLINEFILYWWMLADYLINSSGAL